MLSWPKRKKRERDWRRERREFIYLDEVSVISLVAARDGSIANTITEKLSRNAETESSTSVAIAAKGGPAVGAKSRHRVTDTNSREVVRRTVIQSTFGDLRFGGQAPSQPLVREYRELPGTLAESVENPDDLTAKWNWNLRRLKKHGLLTPLETLRRGDVIEIDVQLRPDRTFSLAAAIDSMADILQGRSEVFGDASVQVAEFVPIVEVIDRLMVGLIPVHGAPSNIVLIEIDDKVHLIDKRVIKRGSPVAATVREWEVVGVTEEPSYWKDLRRVLYTRDRFTVYARVVNPCMITKWNPVKLAELMGDVSDDVARAIADLPDQLERQLDHSSPEPELDPTSMFCKFAQQLEPEFEGVKPEPAIVAHAVSEAVAIYNDAAGDLSRERAAFDSIVAVFEASGGAKLDRESLAEKRSVARAAASAQTSLTETASAETGKPIEQLEVEVIAIYW